MSRSLRLNLTFCLYHVMSRANSGDIVFPGSAERSRFLYYLKKYLGLFHFRLHAYCLMPTHFHLLVESGDLNGLSEMMRRLLTAFTIFYNRRYERHGHLFQGRFKSLVVDKAEYLISLSRYIHLNPENGSNSVSAEKYSGSSLRYYLKGGEPPWLYTKEILSWFDNDRSRYAEYIREGLQEDTSLVIYQRKFIGGASFAKRMQQRIAEYEKRKGKENLPKQSCKDNLEKKADQVLNDVGGFYGVQGNKIRRSVRIRGKVGDARSVAIFLIRETISWSYRKIADYFHLGSINSVKHHLKRIEEDSQMKKTAEKFKGLYLA
ncbi:transposase [Candidatus Sumerlaeota bacterium]|nr:transposase [Candidatus Sumerlaeota bacterium]